MKTTELSRVEAHQTDEMKRICYALEKTYQSLTMTTPISHNTIIATASFQPIDYHVYLSEEYAKDAFENIIKTDIEEQGLPVKKCEFFHCSRIKFNVKYMIAMIDVKYEKYERE